MYIRDAVKACLRQCSRSGVSSAGDGVGRGGTASDRENKAAVGSGSRVLTCGLGVCASESAGVNIVAAEMRAVAIPALETLNPEWAAGGGRSYK